MATLFVITFFAGLIYAVYRLLILLFPVIAGINIITHPGVGYIIAGIILYIILSMVCGKEK
jgi:hypothetical protein